MGLRILVALDGSRCAEAAADVAIQLAKALGGDLVGMHVLNVRAASGNPLRDLTGTLGFEPAIVSPEVLSTHERRGAEILEAFSGRAAASGVAAKTQCVSDTVAKALHHHSNLVDLVVLGRYGETEDRFPGQGGSRISTFLQDIVVPTLVVPPEVREIRSIALAYDGSDGAAHALTAVRKITEGLDVPVHAIHAGEGFEVLDEVEEALPGRTIHRHVVPIEGNVHQLLASEAQAAGASVLAVGFRGGSRVHDFLFESTAETIVLHTQLVLLIAH